MTYPQQQGPPPGYGPYPPKKPNTGLVLGITAAVVVAVLGLVLVLVLAGDDDSGPGPTAGGGAGLPEPTLDYTATDDAPAAGGPAAGGPADSGPAEGPDGGDPAGSADPWELVQEIARIFETQDVDALPDHACGQRDLTFFERDLEQLEGQQVKAEAKDLTETSATEADATIALDLLGVVEEYPIKVSQENGAWCARHNWAD